MSRIPCRRAAGRAILAAAVAGATLAGAGGAPPVGAATVTVGADADAKVSSAKPKANYGRDTLLTADASPAEESYIRFTVSGASGPVTRAVVRLYVTNGSVDGPAIYRVGNTSWGERGIKWSNKPARDPGALSDVGAVASGGYVEFDVTPAVTGDGTYSFALASASSDNTDFSSKEASSNRPQLVVTTDTAPPPPPPPPPPPGDVTRTFDPIADAKVAQETPNTNFGTTSTLETDAVPIVESYIKFSVDGITGPVSKAVLRGYVVNGSPNGPAVYRTEPGWTEGGINWSNRTVRTSGPMDDKGAVSAKTWVEWDVTAVVGANDVYSFNLATNANDGTDISSREASSNRPHLLVTFAGSAGSDTTPPDTVMEDGPSGTIAVDNATFRFSATEGGSTFACHLDTAAWSDCSSPLTLDNLANGNHTFYVRATDPAGNTDASPATRSFSVAAVDIRQAPMAPPSGAHFGAHVQAGDRTEAVVSAAVGQVETAIDRPLAIDMWYEPWPNVFPTWREQWDVDNGRIPMISWGKWYTDQIAAGQHDAYIRARADGIRNFGHPVMIRWFWEMDGNRNIDYAISPASYIAAWKHIVDIFRERGATNAAWVWCPNASGFTDGTAQPWYPGDSYVDWLCADGYNFYPERADNRSFEATFASFYDWARQRPKPIVIGEYGALQDPQSDNRAAWINAARDTVKTKMTRILGLVWFHSVHEHDWTLLSEPSALEAFRQMGLDPYFNPPSP